MKVLVFLSMLACGMSLGYGADWNPLDALAREDEPTRIFGTALIDRLRVSMEGVQDQFAHNGSPFEDLLPHRRRHKLFLKAMVNECEIQCRSCQRPRLWWRKVVLQEFLYSTSYGRTLTFEGSTKQPITEVFTLFCRHKGFPPREFDDLLLRLLDTAMTMRASAAGPVPEAPTWCRLLQDCSLAIDHAEETRTELPEENWLFLHAMGRTRPVHAGDAPCAYTLSNIHRLLVLDGYENVGARMWWRLLSLQTLLRSSRALERYQATLDPSQGIKLGCDTRLLDEVLSGILRQIVVNDDGCGKNIALRLLEVYDSLPSGRETASTDASPPALATAAEHPYTLRELDFLCRSMKKLELIGEREENAARRAVAVTAKKSVLKPVYNIKRPAFGKARRSGI